MYGHSSPEKEQVHVYSCSHSTNAGAPARYQALGLHSETRIFFSRGIQNLIEKTGHKHASWCRTVHQFPVAAVTNDDTADGLKPQKSVLSPFWRPDVTVPFTGLKSRCRQAMLPPVALEKNLFLASSSSGWLPELLGHVTPIPASALSLLPSPSASLLQDTCDGVSGPPRRCQLILRSLILSIC